MKDQLNESLIKILEKIISGAESGVEFLKGEIPEIVEQLIVWKTVEHFVLLAIGLLLFTVIPTITYIKRNEIKDREHVIIGCVVINLLSSVLGICLFCKNISPLLQAYLAPKIYIIEYIGTLVK